MPSEGLDGPKGPALVDVLHQLDREGPDRVRVHPFAPLNSLPFKTDTITCQHPVEASGAPAARRRPWVGQSASGRASPEGIGRGSQDGSASALSRTCPTSHKTTGGSNFVSRGPASSRPAASKTDRANPSGGGSGGAAPSFQRAGGWEPETSALSGLCGWREPPSLNTYFPPNSLTYPRTLVLYSPRSAIFSLLPTGQSDTGQWDMAPNPRAQCPGLTPPRWTRARDVALM